MSSYNKLVRDNIPDKIKANGEVPLTHVASDEEYREKLAKKLVEERDEFFASPSAEEAGDMLEVLHAMCTMHNINIKDVEKARVEKYEARGGFAGRVILDGVEE